MFGALAATFQRRQSETQRACTPGACTECHGESETFSLDKVPCGNSCMISCISERSLSPAVQRRLAELGLRAGSKVTVTQKINAGGRVLKIGTTRYALDGATAAQLQVTAV